jgi:hypothetical protein
MCSIKIQKLTITRVFTNVVDLQNIVHNLCSIRNLRFSGQGHKDKGLKLSLSTTAKGPQISRLS